jgi:hypothetical protein
MSLCELLLREMTISPPSHGGGTQSVDDRHPVPCRKVDNEATLCVGSGIGRHDHTVVG